MPHFTEADFLLAGFWLAFVVAAWALRIFERVDAERTNVNPSEPPRVGTPAGTSVDHRGPQR